MNHDCKVCNREGFEGTRAEWGCDKATPEAQCYIPCVRCDQTDPECDLCKGEGWEPIYRCPYSQCDRFTWEVVALHTNWPKVMPFPGGVYDQPAPYVSAMRILDAATGKMRKLLEDEAARKKPQVPNAKARTA